MPIRLAYETLIKLSLEMSQHLEERLTEESIAEVPGLNSFTYQNFCANYLIENLSAVESLLSHHQSQHLNPLTRGIDVREKLIH